MTDGHEKSKNRLPQLIKESFEKFSNKIIHENPPHIIIVFPHKRNDESINRFPQINKTYFENIKNIKVHDYRNCTYRFLPLIQTDVQSNRTFPILIKESIEKFSNIKFPEIARNTRGVYPRRQTDIKIPTVAFLK